MRHKVEKLARLLL